MSASIQNIVLVGSGQVASFFGNIFLQNGCTIQKVISRNKEKGAVLASKLHAEYSETYKFDSKADLVLLAVKDDTIEELAALFEPSNTIICHCAGAVSIDVFKKFNHSAVLYPLQSISNQPSIQNVPVLLECKDESDAKKLQDLMQLCGFNYQFADSKTRRFYHLAAVFANNFSNAMLSAAETIVKKQDLDYTLLHKLIQHTFENAINHGAIYSQTGPALREDSETMHKHLNLLKDEPELSTLYKAVSEFILTQKKH